MKASLLLVLLVLIVFPVNAQFGSNVNLNATIVLLIDNFFCFLQNFLCQVTFGIFECCGDDDDGDGDDDGDDGTTTDNNDGTPTTNNENVWTPAPGTTWQWQLQGDIDTSFDVDMYDIDLFDTPQSVIDTLHSDGRIVICYFSAGSYENFRDDAVNFPAAVRGSTLDGFADEQWLDVRAIDALAPVMRARLDLAVSKQCDGVEPDNVDGYQNESGFPLTPADQLAYNRWLATEAHARNLSIGLKNDLDQVAELVNDFDWAINEQCFEFDECEVLLPFVNGGKAVFGVEYVGDNTVYCPVLNALQYSWLEKDIDLFALPRIDCMDL